MVISKETFLAVFIVCLSSLCQAGVAFCRKAVVVVVESLLSEKGLERILSCMKLGCGELAETKA